MLITPRYRRLQPVEIYSQRYYKEKIAKGAQKEIKEKGVSKPNALAVIRRHTREAFEAEPQSLRDEIFAEFEAQKRDNSLEDGEPSLAGIAA